MQIGWIIVIVLWVGLFASCAGIIIHEIRKSPEVKKAEKEKFQKRRAELKAMWKAESKAHLQQSQSSNDRGFLQVLDTWALLLLLFLILILLIVFYG